MPDLTMFVLGLLVPILCSIFLVITLYELYTIAKESEAAPVSVRRDRR